VRHKNFTECVNSLVLAGTFSYKYSVLQVVRCSFDIHVGDIIGSLITGATLTMIHPKGNMDFDYLAEVLRHKQTTYMHTVPTLLNGLFKFLKDTDNISAVKILRSLVSSG
jgi:non-ribosomal peptide synthetase component F